LRELFRCTLTPTSPDPTKPPLPLLLWRRLPHDLHDSLDSSPWAPQTVRPSTSRQQLGGENITSARPWWRNSIPDQERERNTRSLASVMHRCPPPRWQCRSGGGQPVRPLMALRGEGPISYMSIDSLVILFLVPSKSFPESCVQPLICFYELSCCSAKGSCYRRGILDTEKLHGLRYRD
jgi:hypothetical protein